MEGEIIVCKMTGKKRCETCTMWKQLYREQAECWQKSKIKMTKAGHRNLFSNILNKKK